MLGRIGAQLEAEGPVQVLQRQEVVNRDDKVHRKGKSLAKSAQERESADDRPRHRSDVDRWRQFSKVRGMRWFGVILLSTVLFGGISDRAYGSGQRGPSEPVQRVCRHGIQGLCGMS